MRTLYIIVLHSLFLGLSACTSKNTEYTFTFVQIKSFETAPDFMSIRALRSLISLNPVDSTIHLYFQNLQSRKIFCYSLSKDSLIPNYNIDFTTSAPYFSFFIKSVDSIYMFDNETYNLLLINKTGQLVKKYAIDSEYTPFAIFPCGLLWNHNSILIGNSSKTQGVGLKKDRSIYYKEIKPVLQLIIKDNSLSCEPIAKFPTYYSTTCNSYYDIFPSICFGKSDDICVSFGADNNLYLYHDSTLVLTKPVKNKFIDKFNPYPDEKQFDMLFLQSYIIDEPKYKGIVYDPYESLYYRIAKLRAKKTIEGTMRSLFSVIILDSKLNVLDEVIMDTEFEPDIFIPTPFGILMAEQSTKIPGKTILTVNKLKRNEK